MTCSRRVGRTAIGPSREVPGLWLATGHEGAGVGLGPVTGRLVAQLYCGEEPVVDPSPFDPDRFSSPGWDKPWSETEYVFTSDFGHRL